MAGKIQWQLEFIGLDVALNKLREIDRLLQRITSNNGGINVGVSSAGSSPNAQRTAGGGGGLTSLATAAALVGGGLYLRNRAGASTTSAQQGGQGGAGGGQQGPGPYNQGPQGPSPYQGPGGSGPTIINTHPINNRTGWWGFFQRRKKLGYNAPAGLLGEGSNTGVELWHGDIPSGARNITPGALMKTMGGMGDGGYQSAYERWQQYRASRTAPSNWSNAWNGMGTGTTAPSLGAGGGGVPPVIPGLGGAGGAAGGGGGGLAALGTVAAVIGAVIIAFKALKKVIEIVMAAFELLVEGIKHGAQIYQQGAASGVGIRKSNQLREALRAIGINEEPTYQMKMTTGTAGVIGAARASGFGGAQQLQNMAGEFERAMQNAASSARQMELVGKANQMLSQDMMAITREFKTMLAEAAANLYPILHSIFQTIQDYLKIINLYFELLAKIKSLIPGGVLLPTGKPGTANWPTGGGVPHINAWEKIGFTFGRGGPTTALDSINSNTKKSSETLQSIYEYVKIFMRLAGGPMQPAAQFLP